MVPLANMPVGFLSYSTKLDSTYVTAHPCLQVVDGYETDAYQTVHGQPILLGFHPCPRWITCTTAALDVNDKLMDSNHRGLYSCQHSSFPAGFFQDVPNLTSIYSQNGRLVRLVSGTFKGLSKVSILSVPALTSCTCCLILRHHADDWKPTY